MKYASQNFCEKTIDDDEMALHREFILFSELYKIMVNKVNFFGFRGGNRPPLDPPLSQR